MLTYVTLQMSGVCKAKGKETACKHCTPADEVVPMGALFNNFDTVTGADWN